METAPLQPQETDTAPGLYADGFQIQLTNASFVMLLKLGDRTITTLRFSYVTGKTLQKGLNQIFEALEEVTGRKEADSEEMNEFLGKVSTLVAAKTAARAAAKAEGEQTRNG